MNTGPVGAGREVGRRDRNGDQKAGAHLRTQECAPKARTQKKCLTLETYRASAPRIHLKPRWTQDQGGIRGAGRDLCDEPGREPDGTNLIRTGLPSI